MADTNNNENTNNSNVVVKEMSWDPITRIVGSLGIHTKIDFANKKVLECYSTSMIFRGFDIIMRGRDPRDSHFIASRICGICGDNHTTCSILNQNMAYGVKPPALGDYVLNMGEASDYMFDHAIFNDNMANVDFCEKMIKETNPKVLAEADKTPAEHADIHGFNTIGDIMRALNPFTGKLYLDSLQQSRVSREMVSLMEGRHAHPSTLLPGGVSTTITIQTLTDFYLRLMKYMDYVKKIPYIHDDLYDFFYRALPGYEKVGYRDIELLCLGTFDDPDLCDYKYENMSEWGRARMVTPGVVIGDELVTTDLIEINLGRRILMGSSYYESWENETMFVEQDPLGNKIDRDHPWNKTTIPKPQKRDFNKKYSWVTSPRWFDKRTKKHLALDTGGGPLARQWVTAKAGLVNTTHIKATGHSLNMFAPKTASMAAMDFEWRIPKWSNAIERDRARAYHQLYAALVALHFCEKALEEIRAGRTKTWTPFAVPAEAISCGFHEAARGALSHHMVLRDHKIANYQMFPPTPWNASPRDLHGTPGPYEDAVQNTPIFEENEPDKFKGIDIMRTVRSFDPCLPCGVHMYFGNGRTLETIHSPSACRT